MARVLTEFIRNAGLISLLNLLLITLCIVAGLVFFFRARATGHMRWFLGVGILPTISGILAMYFKLKITNAGIGLFGRLGPEAIAVGRREALVNLVIGVAASAGILGLRAWRGRLNRKRLT
jgi:hypothetical protein